MEYISYIIYKRVKSLLNPRYNSVKSHPGKKSLDTHTESDVGIPWPQLKMPNFLPKEFLWCEVNF